MALFWFSLAWIAGIALGRATSLDSIQWFALTACSFAALLFFRRNTKIRRIFTILLLLTLGGLRYVVSIPQFGPDHIARRNDRRHKITIVGVIVAPPDVRDRYTGLKIEAQCFLATETEIERPAQGTLLAYASPFDSFQYGDRVRATGFLETPPVFETFSYRDYLARQGVHSIMDDPEITVMNAGAGNPVMQRIYNFRAQALTVIQKIFPDPEASLLAGILLGIESGISPEVRAAFDATGTTHIIAISGFNITIIAAIFVSLFGRWLGVRRGAITAGLAIAVYTILVGADAAVVRAAIMGGFVLLANRLGRQTHGMASLAGAVIVMTAIHPSVLWDVGFQLSFAATLGLILYAEPLQNWFVRTASRWLGDGLAERIAEPVGEFVLFTLAAQLTTLPLTAYYFRRLSLVSVIANPVILPAQPAVMILGGLAALGGSLWLPLGVILAWSAWPFAAFTIRAVEFFAGWNAASIPLGPVSLLVVAAMYTVVFGLTAFFKASAEQHPRIGDLRARLATLRVSMALTLSALAVLTCLTWRGVVDRPDGRLHLTVLDTGGGDAVLIQTPSGRNVLVDGGSSTVELSVALGRRLPPLTAHLDWIVIAGTQEAQIAGLAGAVERFSVGGVLIAGPPSGGAYTKLIDSLTEAGIAIHQAETGQALDLGSGARLEVIAVGDCGAILLLTYNRARFLLAPGADPALIEDVQRRRSVVPVTAMLLADSGYLAVNPPTLLDHLQPRLALISVEAGNKRRLPSPQVLETLQGVTILRTDLHGWIHCVSDGERLWVEVERQVE